MTKNNTNIVYLVGVLKNIHRPSQEHPHVGSLYTQEGRFKIIFERFLLPTPVTEINDKKVVIEAQVTLNAANQNIIKAIKIFRDSNSELDENL